MSPALIGDGEEGGPVLPGKADGLTGRLLARAVLLIPGLGGVLCGYLPCFHHSPPFALRVVGSGSAGMVGSSAAATWAGLFRQATCHALVLEPQNAISRSRLALSLADFMRIIRAKVCFPDFFRVPSVCSGTMDRFDPPMHILTHRGSQVADCRFAWSS